MGSDCHRSVLRDNQRLSFRANTDILTSMRFLLLVVLLPGCAHQPAQTPPVADRAMYTVTLGVDTAYIQWITMNGNSFEMRVAERIPRVRALHLTGKLNRDGTIASLDRRAYLPNASDTSPVERITIRAIGDSTIFETTTRTTKSRYATRGHSPLVVGAYNGTAFPVIARYAPARLGDSVVSTHIGGYFGNRVLVIKRTARDSIRLTSRHLGPAFVHVGINGQSNGFNAQGTSLNTVGVRSMWLPFDSVMKSFADAERARGISGIASPRDTARASIDAAKLVVEYGRPSKRGRKIFGGIVPFNQVWRAGANEATQFTTNRALRFGANELPAGRYTFWIIPTPTRWTLIVNNETDQWGTDYKESFDRFRIPMKLSALDHPLEKFTIEMNQFDAGGVIQFRWDTVEATVPFTVVR